MKYRHGRFGATSIHEGMFYQIAYMPPDQIYEVDIEPLDIPDLIALLKEVLVDVQSKEDEDAV